MLDRTVSPVGFSIPRLSLPPIESSILSNGIHCHYIDGAEQEVLRIDFLFQSAGSVFEDKTGTSYLVSHLLQSGTARYSAEEIANLLAETGSFIQVNPSFDYIEIILYSLTKHIDRVLPCIVDIINSASFPEKEIILKKKQLINNIRLQNSKTNAVASKIFRNTIFDGSNPYSKIITENDLHEINRADLISFQVSIQGGISVIIGGKIAKVRSSINNILENIKNSEKPVVPGRDYAFSNKLDRINKRLEQSEQASIRIGCQSIGRNHTDYPSLMLTNHILGGYFGSRLMKEIRENKGLTYGIHSSITTLKKNAFFSISSDVNKDNVEGALLEINREINLLGNQPISESELITAKNHFIGSFQSSLSNPLSINSKVKNTILYQLPSGYYDSLIEELSQTEINTIHSISHQYLDPSKMTTVVIS